MSFTAGLGAHQSDRRLCLAAEPQSGRREVQAVSAVRKILAISSEFFGPSFVGWKDMKSALAYVDSSASFGGLMPGM